MVKEFFITRTENGKYAVKHYRAGIISIHTTQKAADTKALKLNRASGHAAAYVRPTAKKPKTRAQLDKINTRAKLRRARLREID